MTMMMMMFGHFNSQKRILYSLLPQISFVTFNFVSFLSICSEQIVPYWFFKCLSERVREREQEIISLKSILFGNWLNRWCEHLRLLLRQWKWFCEVLKWLKGYLYRKIRKKMSMSSVSSFMEESLSSLSLSRSVRLRVWEWGSECLLEIHSLFSLTISSFFSLILLSLSISSFAFHLPVTLIFAIRRS